MNVLIVSDMVGGPGGVYTHIKQIESLASSTIKINILFDEGTKSYVKNIYNFQNVDFLPLSYKFHQESEIIKCFQDSIESYEPDLVHVMNGSIKSNLLIRKYLIEKKIPLLTTEHYIDDALLTQKETLEEVRDINLFTDHVIYVSEDSRKIAKDILNIVPRSYSVIRNGVIPTSIRKNNFSENPSRIYTVGRCVPQKGIDVAIKALAKISSSGLSLHVIGDGEHRKEYENLAANILEGRHEFKILGWTNKIDYEVISQEYDLFLSASRQEGLSYGLVEASVIGMPMICSRASGNVELLDMCRCGQLVGINDVDGLAQAINSFLSKPDILNQRALHGSVVSNKLFDANNAINQLCDIYSKLISS